MNKKAKDIFINYFRRSETPETDFLMGIEIEHFIVHQDSLKAVTYYEENGIETILKNLLNNNPDWEPVWEDENLIGLQEDKIKISLEPGGQLEVSINPEQNILKIENIYLNFLQDIIPVLEDKDMFLLTLGYQPEDFIKNIPLLPRKRYKYMYKYFKNRGKYAHHMMKGTASIHVNFDYADEIDFIKKMKVSNFLSPLIYCFFDNTPFFEGKVVKDYSVREDIWNNCDPDRCGIIKEVFNDDFGYEKYAEYMLNIPPILFKKGDNIVYTKNKILKNLINDPQAFNKNQVEYVLRMVFPDIRAKNFIEIRMGDSLPYPYSLGYLAFWKGLLYNEKNLNDLYQRTNKYSTEQINKIINNIAVNKLNTNIEGKKLYDFFIDLLIKAGNGVNQVKEKKFLSLLKEMILEYKSPKNMVLNKLSQGKKESLKWNILSKNANFLQKECSCN